MYNQTINELKSARIYGITGIILEFFGEAGTIILHEFGLILPIIGLILLFLSLKSISNYYGDQKPFRYMLYSLITGIVLAIISGILLIILFMPVLLDPSSIAAIFSVLSVTSIETMFVGSFFIFIGMVISIIFAYMAYNSVADLTGIHEFHTAAVLLLTGIILTIVFVGIILLLIAIIMLIIAFNKLPDNANPLIQEEDASQSHNEGFF